MSREKAKVGPISDLYQEYGLFGQYVLTKRGSLIGAIELSGRDPDGLLPIDYQGLSWIARNIYQHYGSDVVTTQYYVHYDGAKVRLRPREHRISALLSRRREKFLNSKSLTTSRLVHFFEIPASEVLSKLKPVEFLKHLAGAAIFRASRQALRQALSSTEAIVVRFEELRRQELLLDQVRKDTIDKWSSLLDARLLSTQETWAFLRFLSNLDPGLLHSAMDEDIPPEGWDALLTESDVVPTTVQGMDTLALRGAVTRYARICSVTQHGGREVKEGLWAAAPTAPVRLNKNFVLMMRFAPFTRLQQALMFSSKENELARRNFNIRDALRGVASGDNKQATAEMKPAIAERLKELGEAEMLDDIYGNSTAYLVTYDINPLRLRDNSTALKNAANKSGLQVCWESVGLVPAWKSLMPGGREFSERDIPITTTQFGAASLLYRTSTGQQSIPDLNNEEAQYIVTSGDGTPFHYSSFVGGRSVVFGVGPIRTGKSFMRACLNTHFLKYGDWDRGLGSLLRCIDIDAGSEPVAQSFGVDGAIFRVDRGGDTTRGFNLFSSCSGPHDHDFVAHLRSQIIRMMATNENESLRQPNAREELRLDEAIQLTIQLPRHMQRLSTVASHCPQDLRLKFARWIHDPNTTKKGMYAHLMDAPTDAIGSLTTRVAAFNLAGVKDDPVALPLIMAELWYRIKRSFEDPALRRIPKHLDIDEAHALLAIPSFAKDSEVYMRTCGKHLASIAFWSQSPGEFRKLEAWPALRSAGSTIILLADPNMEESLYRETFHLTPGECEAVRRLTPKREAYIIQRDIGVSKRIILEAEPEQYVVATSHPRESSIRKENFDKYGFDEGIVRTMHELGLDSQADESHQSTGSTKEVA